MKSSYANAGLLMAVLIAGSAVAQGVQKPAPVAPAATNPPRASSEDDFALVQQHCAACHSIDQVTAAKKTGDEWSETMDRMVDHGLQLTPEESQRIQAYLTAHYGPKNPS